VKPASIAEFETDIRKERKREVIDKAKANGWHRRGFSLLDRVNLLQRDPEHKLYTKFDIHSACVSALANSGCRGFCPTESNVRRSAAG
jgi:DNA invertase Pin-like site-specific DNA recombinase